MARELSNLIAFSVTKVLNENADKKSMSLLGRFENHDGEAIVLLEKQSLTDDLCEVFCRDASTKLEFSMQNDIYGLYTGSCEERGVNQIKVTVIHPTTARMIDKYSRHELHMVRETAEDYRTITRPYVQEVAQDVQWVENILEKKAERERVLCEDDDPETGFALAADMKWNQQQMEEMYVLALCRKRGLRTIRDLDGRHVAMLRNIRDKSLACLKSRFGLEPSQVRVFLHYQPSYYHLHVHFTHTHFQQGSSAAGRGPLLDDIIDNITLIDEHYYQKCALTYQLHDSHPLLLRLLRTNGSDSEAVVS